MKRFLLLLLAFHGAPLFGQYYGADSGGMGSVPTMPPAPPPVNGPPAYPDYDYSGAGGDAGYEGYGPASGYGDIGGAADNIITYGFLRGGYRYQKPENSALEGSHGFAVSLSAELFDPLFIKGDFGWSTSGSGSRDYDFTNARLGAGFYLPLLEEKLHIVGEVGGVYGKLDSSRNSLRFTEGAVYARPAIRFAPVEFLEFQGGITFSSADDFDSIIFDVSAFFRVLSHLDLGVGVDWGDDFTGFTGGLRLRW